MRRDSERLTGDDEIDLFELLEGVWEQRIIIFLVSSVVFLLAVLYVILAKPVYEAKIFIQPPSQNDIAHLNYGRGGDSGLAPLVVKDIYEIYLRNLQSEGVRRSFFNDVYLPTLTDDDRSGSRDDLYTRFSEVLKINVAAKDTPLRYAITANVSDPEQASRWVVIYAEMASERARKEVLADARSDAIIKSNNLERLITSAQERAKKQREDRIANLTEALKIAKSIGLEKPPIITGNVSTEVSAEMEGALTYMRGSKALESEIDNLKNRVSDDPFISNLRLWQSGMKFYRELNIDPAAISVYRQDGGIQQPDQAVRPKKTLILIVSLFAGAALGVVVAGLRKIWLRKREHE